MILRCLFIVLASFNFTACSSEVGVGADAPTKYGTNYRVAGAEEITQEAGRLGTYVDLSPSEFAVKMNDHNVVLIDVRTPGEVAQGKIEGALELDYRAANIEAVIAQLDPDKTYLVYCAVGGRSAKVADLLIANGAAEVYNLAGGYGAWPK
ncbi:rhodanese-like domain-containing protein [Neolewinella antarctica]|uniref:Rhodanese-related sulfurtransferase n=1 Tax=Neolewinella antarctica TaxID=442734 RepID=A0ABX0XEJ8_9BACT|nr:rhodanese-like domain-containing protein [Neolewinella antarctica]NJC27530.1 rhodanese-related sulfurtransferase [Neolewinella antarctica]